MTARQHRPSSCFPADSAGNRSDQGKGVTWMAATAVLYEAMYILPTVLTEEEAQGVAGALREALEAADGEFVSDEIFGHRRLAFPIDHHVEGTYRLLYFRGNGAIVDEMKHQFTANESVIRGMVVLANPKALWPPPERRAEARAKVPSEETSGEPSAEAIPEPAGLAVEETPEPSAEAIPEPTDLAVEETPEPTEPAAEETPELAVEETPEPADLAVEETPEPSAEATPEPAELAVEETPEPAEPGESAPVAKEPEESAPAQ